MSPSRSVRSAFHDGELEVQRRAGVSADAARLARMLAPADLRGGAARGLAGMTFAVLTGLDGDGARWASPLWGPAGFIAVEGPASLAVHAVPRIGDPLHGLPAGAQVGLIAVDFAAARRVRVNGALASAGATRLRIDAREAFVNCPQHIGPHAVTLGAEVPATVSSGATPAPAQVRLVRAAAAFFLGTAHPERGADVSHKGGPPGFVRVDARGLWWPDFPGNNMFNSFGNLLADPSAALLFLDFATGDTLHLSGRAEVEWSEPGGPGDDEGTGRRVRFTPTQVVEVLTSRRRASPAR